MIVSEKSKSIFENLSRLWMSALVISQVFLPKLVALWIVFGVLHTIFGIIIKERKFQFSWISIGFASIYLFYLIGMLFSKNIPLGLGYLENKLSFIVFAFIFSFPPPKNSWIAVSSSYVLSVITAIMLGFGNSWLTYKQLPELGLFDSFTAVHFSYLHHPSYFAAYILTAFFLLIKLKTHYFPQKFKLLFGLIFLLFTIAYIATFSLAAFLFLAILIGVLLLKFIFQKIPSPYSWFSILVLPFVFYFFFWSIPSVKNQVEGPLHYMKTYLQNPGAFLESKNRYIEGDETRIVMWTVTVEEIIANPLGVGTGSVDLHLSNRLKSHGLYEIAKMDDRKTIIFNPHNQYLQLGLEIGIPGLLLFLSLIVYTIRLAYKEKNWILLLIIVSLAFNSLFESMLQRQSGIVFYSFFILFFSLNFSKETKTLNN